MALAAGDAWLNNAAHSCCLGHRVEGITLSIGLIQTGSMALPICTRCVDAGKFVGTDSLRVIEHRSLWFEVKILLRAVGMVSSRHNAF